MNVILKGWSGYVRITNRWPGLAAIVPFTPVVLIWAAVAESGLFPRAFFPGPSDVVQSFLTLTYKLISARTNDDAPPVRTYLRANSPAAVPTAARSPPSPETASISVPIASM